MRESDDAITFLWGCGNCLSVTEKKKGEVRKGDKRSLPIRIVECIGERKKKIFRSNKNSNLRNPLMGRRTIRGGKKWKETKRCLSLPSSTNSI